MIRLCGRQDVDPNAGLELKVLTEGGCLIALAKHHEKTLAKNKPKLETKC